MTKMPDPVAYLFSVGPYRYASVDDAPQHELPSQCVKHGLLTTTQAEAYKDTCVREALEEAAALCDRFAARDMRPAECAGTIRELIPREPK